MKKFSLLLTLFLLISTNHIFSQWSLTNGPHGAQLERIAAFNNSIIATRFDAFAQRDDYFSCDRVDLIWARKGADLPVINSFYSFGSSFYANTDEGIYVTTDEGSSWKKAFGSIPNPNVERLYIAGANIFTVVNKGYLYFSENSGITWTKVKDDDHYISGASCVASTSTGDTIFVGFRNNQTGMRVSYNRGKKWDSLFQAADSYTKSFYSLDVIDGNIVACGDHGIFVSSDGGKKWVNSSLGWDISKIMKIDSLYAVYSPETRRIIFLSKNNNNTFSPVRYLPVKIEANDFTVKDNIIYVVTSVGVYLSSDLGETWSEANQNLNACYTTGLATQSVELYASVYKKGVYRSTDTGLSWEKISADPDLPSFSTIIPNGDILFGLYEYQRWYAISKNGGKTWDNYYITVNEAVPNCIYKTNDGLLMGTSRGIFFSADSGKTFTEVDKNLSDVNIYGITGNTHYLFASSKESLLKSTDNGKSWAKLDYAFKYNNLKGVSASGSIVFAYNYDGWTYVSIDYGETWKTINQPFTSIRSICIVGNNIFAVALNDNLYLSKDKGETWQPVGNAFYKNTINSIVTDAENIYAATNAGIYKAKLSDFGVYASAKDDEIQWEESDIQIYPNPASDFIRFSCKEQPTRIEILNSRGEKVISAAYTVAIDISALSTGVYYARVYNQQGSSFTKFIVVR